MVHIFYQDSRQTFWIMGANLHEMPIVGPIVQQKMASASPTTVPFFIDGTCLPDAVAWGHAPLLMAAVAVLLPPTCGRWWSIGGYPGYVVAGNIVGGTLPMAQGGRKLLWQVLNHNWCCFQLEKWDRTFPKTLFRCSFHLEASANDIDITGSDNKY